jgi:putative ABC transport system ATP-binding protein
MTTSDNDVIVRLENVAKTYRAPGSPVAVEALRGVSLTVRRGEYLAIVGTSGSGKTTLLNIMGCLDRPTAGTYHLGALDVSRLDDEQLSDVRGRHIGFIFQNFNLISAQTVIENLATPLFYQGVPGPARRQLATQMAERVRLHTLARQRPHELSGGQQQRVAIGRALMNNPDLLLADEPTGNLDTSTGQMILDLLDDLSGDGRTIIIVTHDPSVAARCHRRVEICDGRISTPA